MNIPHDLDNVKEPDRIGERYTVRFIFRSPKAGFKWLFRLFF